MRVRTCPLFLNGIVLLKTGFVAGSLLSGHVNQWHIHFAPHSSVRRVESILQANTCCLPSITSFHCALCCSYFKLRLVLGEFSPLLFFYPLTVSRQRFLPEETRRPGLRAGRYIYFFVLICLIGLGRQPGSLARGHDGVLMASCRGRFCHWTLGGVTGLQATGAWSLLSLLGGTCDQTTIPFQDPLPLFWGLGLLGVV